MTCENQKNSVTADAVAELNEMFPGKIRNCPEAGPDRGRVVVCTECEEDVINALKYAKEKNFAVVNSNNPKWTLDAKKNDGDAVFICVRNINHIGKIDPIAMSVRVGVGARWRDVVEKVSAAGFTVGARAANLDTSVGKWVVSNAVGVGSYKYGTAKDNVLSVRAITNELDAIETGYDNIGYYMSGYNLTQLFVGSEGTLGIITEVTLKLAPLGEVKPVVYKFPDNAALAAAALKLVHHPSIKPMDIMFCGQCKALILAFQESPEVIELMESELDALFEGATKDYLEDAQKKWATRYDMKLKNKMALVPLTKLGEYMDSLVFEYMGVIADRSTALIISKTADAFGMGEVTEFGGRMIEEPEMDWTPYYLGKVEDKKLPRTVTPEFISALKEIVGENNVTTSGMDCLLYSKDMAPLPKMAGIAFNNIPDVVARPNSVAQVSKIMALAYQYGVPVTPRGHGSWGLGGCQPTNKGLVLDFSEKFNKIINIDTDAMTVKVGCGCTWKELLDKVMKKGYIIGSYPSSFPAATLGAWISTNGMGIGSYKYGSAKDNILNMEVVLCDGTVLECGNDTIGTYYQGYNLNQIFSGCEGTLAFFATVTFRLYPMGVIKPLAYDFANMADANGTIQKIVNHPSVKPLHIAWSDENHFINQKKAGLHVPDVRNVLLVTLQGDEKFVALEESVIDKMVAEEGLGTKVEDPAVAAHEWDERCYEFRARHVGVGEIPAEVIVPAHDWGAMVGRSYEGFDKMKMEMGGVIGVMVDRNTTLFMPYYFKDDEGMLGMLSYGFNFYFGDVAAEYGGRSTGFGIFFAHNLDNIHDADTCRYMRRLKTMLDPHDVVNPGHVTCGMTRFGIDMNKSLMGIGSVLMQVVKKMLPRDTTFADNKKRFRYNKIEERKHADRHHILGFGAE